MGLPQDLKNYRADDSFQILTAGDVLRLLVLWGLVAMVLDAAGLLT